MTITPAVIEKKPRKTRSDKGNPRMKKAEKLKYTCECCGEFDKEEVGIATGFNGVEMRVCGNCDIDGYNYDGWGGYYED